MQCYVCSEAVVNGWRDYSVQLALLCGNAAGDTRWYFTYLLMSICIYRGSEMLR